MTNKIIIYIIIFILLVNICKSDKIIIEETDEFILDGISSFLISNSENYAYIINGSNSFVIKINLENGRIQKSFKSGIFLSDSLSKSNHLPFKHRGQDWKFIDSDNMLNKFNYDAKNNSNIINYLNNIFQFNNIIYVPSLSYAYKYSLKDDNNRSIEPRHIYLILDTNLNLQKVNVFEINKLIFTRDILSFNNEEIICQVKNEESLQIDADIKDYKYDCLAIYDKNGFYKKTILNLDSFYTENKYIYNLPYRPVICKNNSDMWYSFPYASKIKLLNSNKYINLDVDLYSKDELEKIKISYEKNKNKSNSDLLNKEIECIRTFNDTLQVTIKNYIDKERFYDIKYFDINNGKFLKTFSIGNNGLIKIAFNKSGDIIFAIYYDKINENYYIKKIKIQ